MLANLLIGLREGLEAALIVGILVAYLVKIERKRDTLKVWIGVGIAILLSVSAALGLTAIEEEASEEIQELLAGTFSLVAAAFVTWMIFWMARQGRFMAKELHGKVDKALEVSAWSLATVAFLAVIREGLETAVFVWSSTKAADSTDAVLGVVIGLVVSAVLGYLIYLGALRLNLGMFFKYTGAFLIIVAAGVGAYGVHELQEVGVLPFLTDTAYDLSGIFPEGSLVEALLRGTITFRAAPSVLEVIVWISFVAIVGTLFARQYRKPVDAKK